MRTKISGIKVPTNDTILSRTSTIAKSLATSIIPRIDPSDNEIKTVESFFMEDGEMKCAYCSEPAVEWDHLHALINKTKPSGYITELFNLVPCCKDCNQSKGSKEWSEFLDSTSPRSPRGRGISANTIQKNIEKLEAYDKLHKTIIAFQNLPEYEAYWARYNEICTILKNAQEQAEDFKEKISKTIDNH